VGRHVRLRLRIRRDGGETVQLRPELAGDAASFGVVSLATAVAMKAVRRRRRRPPAWIPETPVVARESWRRFDRLARWHAPGGRTTGEMPWSVHMVDGTLAGLPIEDVPLAGEIGDFSARSLGSG